MRVRVRVHLCAVRVHVYVLCVCMCVCVCVDVCMRMCVCACIKMYTKNKSYYGLPNPETQDLLTNIATVRILCPCSRRHRLSLVVHPQVSVWLQELPGSSG